MKTFKNILLIFIFETIFFWIFLRHFYIPKLYADPEIISINILVIIVIGINILIFLIFQFWTSSIFKKAFLINAFLSPMILILAYNKANENYFSERFYSKTFKNNHYKYTLFIDKTKTDFLLTRTDERKNITNIMGGTTHILNNKILLKMGKEEYVIENDSIKGFGGRNFKLKQ